MAAAGSQKSTGSRARSSGHNGRQHENEGMEGLRRSERGRRICIPLDALVRTGAQDEDGGSGEGRERQEQDK
eukprot:5198625-Heterocapsa_arctica.AAC.2